jgi:hypothetical protein
LPISLATSFCLCFTELVLRLHSSQLLEDALI